MGWRYRKSMTIMPGVRVNFGLHSSSISFGGRGFRTTYSSTGRVTRTVGIPGTGLSYVTTSNSNRQQAGNRQTRSAVMPPRSTTSSATRSANQSRREVPSYEPPALAPAPVHVDVGALNEQIRNIYRTADVEIDWKRILLSDSCDNPSEEWNYYKARVENVLNGDIDTYFEIISDVNPFDDLLQYGSEFECGTNDPRMLSIRFKVNGDAVLANARTLPAEQYNLLLQDYVCGCAIRVARDMFALLPLRHLIVDAENSGRDILSVDFVRTSFVALNFESIDASDTVEQFKHVMDFNAHTGFSAITPLDA